MHPSSTGRAGARPTDGAHMLLWMAFTRTPAPPRWNRGAAPLAQTPAAPSAAVPSAVAAPPAMVHHGRMAHAGKKKIRDAIAAAALLEDYLSGLD